MNDSFENVKSIFSELENKAKEITEIKGKLDVLKQNKLKLKDSYDLQHKANPTECEERRRMLGFYKGDMKRFLVDICSMVDPTYEDMLKVLKIAEDNLQKQLDIAEHEFVLKQNALHDATQKKET